MHIRRLAAAAVTGLAAGALALAGTAQAQDDPAFKHGQPAVTATPTDECDEVELTFTNPTPWLMVFDVRVDGEESHHPSVAEGVEIDEGPLAEQEFGPRWQLVEVDGSAGTHEVTQTFAFGETVEVRLAEGAEQKLYFDWQDVDTSAVEQCPEPPASGPISVEIDGSCEAVDVTFTNDSEYPYSGDVRVDGEDGKADQWSEDEIGQGPLADDTYGDRYRSVGVPAGETVTETVAFDEESGEHEVEAVVRRGPERNWYVPWQSFTVDCGEASGAGGGSKLPETGSPALMLGGVGLGTVVAGGAAFLLARKRRPQVGLPE